MAVLTVLICFASVSAFAQEEVRGIETRKVAYELYDTYKDYYNRETELWRWGFEFHNANSISVSVDIELYEHRNGEQLRDTKTIVLKPNETYVFKQENNGAFKGPKAPENYYIKYKAYKLQ